MTTMHKATFETRNFLFEAYGQTKARARENLITGLQEHARQMRIQANWYQESEEDFRFESYDLTSPVCMRDRDDNLLARVTVQYKQDSSPVQAAPQPQSYTCKPVDLPAGYFWYYEEKKTAPVIVEKRETENFVRHMNGAHQPWIRDGERFVGPISAPGLAPAPATPDEWISVQEAWEAAGENPGIQASKDDLLAALRTLDQVCDEADVSSSASSTQREVFTGYVTIQGNRVQVDFDVPVGASEGEQDTAFRKALAEVADLNYLSMGVADMPLTKPGKPGPSL